jgi:hypothetical protein
MSDFEAQELIREFVARRPRAAGLILLALAGLFLMINLSEPDGSCYPMAYLMGYPLAFAGAWIVLTGWPQELPLWWILGAFLMPIAGLVCAIFAMRSCALL